MLNTIYIELRDQRGRRITSYAVHVPTNSVNPNAKAPEDYEFNAYEDDGRGNGDHLGSERFTARGLESIMSNLGELITRQNL